MILANCVSLRRSRAQATRCAAALSLAASVIGCGATPDASAPADDGERTATAVSAIGEATCATATPDVILSRADGVTTSPDGNYDHPDCRHAYIIVDSASPGTHTASAFYYGPQPTPQYLGCNAAWVAMTVYQWQGGRTTGSWVKLQDVGPVYGYDNFGSCFTPSADFTVQSGGLYKVVAAAGLIYTNVQVAVIMP